HAPLRLGMGTSVALAAAHAACLRAEALILLLADMPLTGAATVRALLAHRPLGQPVAARYPDGRPGVPARFPAQMLDALAGLDEDRGAAGLLRGRADLHLIDMAPGALTDVDDPAGLARAEALLGGAPRIG
ncbi:MAG: NTP transferase domain-containing protein, partial [Sphingobium sp.]